MLFLITLIVVVFDGVAINEALSELSWLLTSSLSLVLMLHRGKPCDGSGPSPFYCGTYI